MFRLRKYIYTDKKHAAKGILGTILAVLALAVFVLVVYFSFKEKGQADVSISTLGLASISLSIVGLTSSIMSFWEEEKYYIFSKIGAVSNILMLFLWICIFLIGV